MSDDIPLSPVDHDPTVEPRFTVSEILDALRDAGRRATAAIEAGRRPGMPLSVLSNVAREAPLGSLLVAFLVGVAIGRRGR